MTGKRTEKAGADPTRLGALETQVMDHLWDHGTSTVADLMAVLPGEPAYTTVATVLANLGKKRLVSRRKKGHASLYEPRMPREEYTARVVDRVLDASGDREAAMLHFVNRMTDDDLDLLRDFLRGRGHPGGST